MYGAMFAEYIRKILKGTYTSPEALTLNNMSSAIFEGIVKAGKNTDELSIKESLYNSLKKYDGISDRYVSKEYCVKGIASVGWFFNSLEKTREVTRLVGEVTKNYPSQIKDAEIISSIIYLSRNGYSKSEINKYLEKEFSFDKRNEDIVSKAFSIFFDLGDSKAFGEVLGNNQIESDLLVCLVAAMSEAFFPDFESVYDSRGWVSLFTRMNYRFLQKFDKIQEPLQAKLKNIRQQTN